MILYHLDKDGGFTAGDTETGRTAYAYPGSYSAFDAKIIHESDAAARMMEIENGYDASWRDQARYVANDASVMEWLVKENLDHISV